MASGADVVLAQAERALDNQATELTEARARAALVFSIVSVSSSFLVGPALKAHKGMPTLGYVAIVLWLASTACAVLVLRPRRFRFSMGARTLMGPGWVDLDDEQLRRNVALLMADNVKGQLPKLDRMWRLVRVAMVLGLLSIATWIALLAKGP